MALVKCKECGREISKKAEVCPHCGYKIKKKHGCLTQIALLVFGVVIFAVFLPTSKDEEHEPYTGYKPTGETPVVQSAMPAEDKISEYALIPYDKDSYPKLFEKYGSRIEELEQYRKEAALKVARNSKCDKVESVELSTKSPLDDLLFFVDCGNLERFYVSEKEIESGESIKANSEIKRDISQLKQSCFNAIKENVNFPSELNLHEFMGTSDSVNKTTGNVVIRTDFEAKNGFGVEKSYTAICTFHPKGDASIEFYEK